jgi:glycosyltransferase involved in cell wall biosynthesis
MTSRPSSIALAMDHPAQQFARALRLLSSEPDLQLRVYYWSAARRVHDTGFDRPVSWDVDLLGGYEWAAPAPDLSITGRIRWLAGHLRATRPELVVCYGWGSPIARTLIIYCLLTRTRVLLYGDSTWQHSARGRHPVLRSVALRILMRSCTGAISTGTFNREFYIRHGMDPRRIQAGVCPADTEAFGAARADGARADGPGDQPVRIGFAGKLIPRKGADELLRATALLPRNHSWSVTLVGDGPMMPELQALAAELGVGDRVSFHGFANTTEMPKLLAGFDVVVVPSRLDMRALITIEAMSAGAAIVVSDATAVWGAGDLVEHEVTGLVYPSGDPSALADELKRLILDRPRLAKLRSNGAQRVTVYGPDTFARTVASAARLAITEGRAGRQGRVSATTGP